MAGYPAQPELICPSVRPSVRPSVCTCLQIRYSAENSTGPTDSVNYSSKSLIHVNRESEILRNKVHKQRGKGLTICHKNEFVQSQFSDGGLNQKIVSR